MDDSDAGPSTSPLPSPSIEHDSTSPRTWRLRRLSQSSLRPTLPSLTNLRSALLGYIGEVEHALRERVVGEEEDHGFSDHISSPSSIGDDEFTSITDFPAPNELRRRNVRSRPTDEGASVLQSDQQAESSNHAQREGYGLQHSSLLDHLTSLREDISRYLPTISVPSVPSANLGARGEWLRSLPHRLRILDLSVAPLPPDHRTPSSPVIDPTGSVEHARQRLIDMVKAYLPDEDWSGWERLGWEEQAEATSRRHSTDLAGGVPVIEPEEEEPAWLFPNRTPASAQAIGTRRRAVRSKSWGAASFPAVWQDEMPKLMRTRTEPLAGNRYDQRERAHGDEEEEEDITDATDVLDGTELVDGVDLGKTPIAATSVLGPTVAEALKAAQDGKALIVYDDLPFLWRNNEHITTGYRFIPLHASTGPIPLIKSAFSWHNETVNIHSHFIPTIMILMFIPIIIYSSPLPDAHPLDTVTLVIYLLAAVSCLISSAGWHVLAGCASHKWFEWGACVDYIGISWLIAASFFTVLYNAFYCQPKTVLMYSSVNLICGILGSYLPFQRWFNERKFKSWRIGFFLFLCFAMFAPMLQLFYQHGWQRGKSFVAPFVPSILTYVSGLVFYAFHFPECVWPGKFDLYGASHNLWHAGIVGAIILHYRAIFQAHGVRYAYSCAMPEASISVGEVVEKGVWMALRAIGLEK